jgi:hypothetical protein
VVLHISSFLGENRRQLDPLGGVAHSLVQPKRIGEPFAVLVSGGLAEDEQINRPKSLRTAPSAKHLIGVGEKMVANFFSSPFLCLSFRQQSINSLPFAPRDVQAALRFAACVGLHQACLNTRSGSRTLLPGK